MQCPDELRCRLPVFDDQRVNIIAHAQRCDKLVLDRDTPSTPALQATRVRLASVCASRQRNDAALHRGLRRCFVSPSWLYPRQIARDLLFGRAIATVMTRPVQKLSGSKA